MFNRFWTDNGQFFKSIFKIDVEFGLDFVVEILLGCVSQDVRERASNQLYRLSQAQNQSSKHSLTQVRLEKNWKKEILSMLNVMKKKTKKHF